MTRYVMVADLNRCIGCQTCTVACRHTNATPPEIQWRKVLDMESGEFPDVERVFVPVGCQHCADPPCMHVCPSTATRQRDDGIVSIDYDLCIGCSYCAVACPYQARYKVDKNRFAYDDKPMPSEEMLIDEKTLGVAQKCTFCSDRVDAGLEANLTPGVDPDATPACVNSCIANALHFGDIEDIESKVSQLVSNTPHFRMHEELGTDPGFYYLWNKNPSSSSNVKSIGQVPQSNWDWRAAGNFMLGGTGGSLLLFAGFFSLPDAPHPLVVSLAMLLVGLGLLFVWAEIGRPRRFLHVLFHPRTSWMTRESGVAVAFFALAITGIVLSLPVVVAVAGVMGLLFVYCQARVLKASKGIPAWRQAAIVPLILATGLTEGAALLLLLLAAVQEAMPWLDYLLLGLLVARAVAAASYLHALARAKAPEATISVLKRTATPFLMVGSLIPLILIIIEISITTEANIAIIIAGILALVSGWYVKFTIVTRAAHVQGFSLGVPGPAS